MLAFLFVAILKKAKILLLCSADIAYIDYEKQQRMTEFGVTYVTKMKKNLRYEEKTDIVYPSTDTMVYSNR